MIEFSIKYIIIEMKLYQWCYIVIISLILLVVMKIVGMSHKSKTSSGIYIVVDYVLYHICFPLPYVQLIWIMIQMVRLNEFLFYPKSSHILIPGFSGLNF